MDIFQLQNWIQANPSLSTVGAIVLVIILYGISRIIFGRGLIYLTQRTKNKYDDIIMQRVRPYRVAWFVPFIILYAFAYLAGEQQAIVQKVALFFMLWLTALSLNGLLDALNQIYESGPAFTGVSIQGYLDIVKILILVVGIILSVSLFTGESPILLLSGLGALTAVLMFIFHDTILAVIASIQISTHDLVKEGDWLEVPSYDADGDVINMSLHTIKIQNWDKTISVIPTHKMMEVSYKNWRGMQESGGRRIKRALQIDKTSIRFCDANMLARFRKINLIADFIEKKQQNIETYRQQNHSTDSPLDGPQVTNVEIYRAYIEAFLKNHPDIHIKKMTFLVRELAPGPMGLPIEIYVFTKTTQWSEYERIQAEVFDHLLAATQFFDLRLFQEPSGSDFAAYLANK
jgi:miniconductance mechanosensitive channel